MMTKRKDGNYSYFSAFLDSSGYEEYITWKKKQLLGSTFCCPKVWQFLSFFWYVFTCQMSALVLLMQNFEMLQHSTFPTKGWSKCHLDEIVVIFCTCHFGLWRKNIIYCHMCKCRFDLSFVIFLDLWNVDFSLRWNCHYLIGNQSCNKKWQSQCIILSRSISMLLSLSPLSASNHCPNCDWQFLSPVALKLGPIPSLWSPTTSLVLSSSTHEHHFDIVSPLKAIYF